MKRHFRQADPVPPTSGNPFAPPVDDGWIDGGYRQPRQRRAAAIMAIAAVAGAALIRWRRRSR